DAGDGDGAGAVGGEVELLVDLAGELDGELVARAENVAGADRDLIDRGEGGRDATEERGAEDGKTAAGGSFDHALEFGFDLRRGCGVDGAAVGLLLGIFALRDALLGLARRSGDLVLADGRGGN